MRRRNKQKNIRMTEDEVEHIEQKAKKAGMDFSSYIISAAINKDIIVIDGIKEFTHQLSKLGANINQLLILVHQGKINCLDITQTNNLLNEIWHYLVSIRKNKKFR
ncbi:UNVERIFIED_CONTAM: hypothetical protein Cloal_0204 [Acetivibrio alkalicellulosi]